MPRFRLAPTLTEAIYRGDRDRVQALLAEGADPNQAAARYAKDTSLPTLPLTVAVERGEEDLVRQLVSAGADPNGSSIYVQPLSRAMTQNAHHMARVLIELGASVAQKRNDGFYSGFLEEACSFGSADCVEVLLEHGAGQLPHKNNLFVASLANGSNEGQKRGVRLLMDAGFDPRIPDRHGNHPIAYAVVKGDAELVQWFLEAGADANLVNRQYISNHEAQDLCLAGCAIARKAGDGGAILEVLARHGAALDVRVDFNINTMGLAAKMQGSDAQVMNEELRLRGMSLLALAAVYDARCVHTLIQQGLDPNDAGDSGSTALHAWASRYACQTLEDTHLPALEALLELGADANACDTLGNTPLHLLADRIVAASNPHGAIPNAMKHALGLFLSYGADPRIENHRGITPMDLARTNISSNDGHQLLVAHAQKCSLQEATSQPGGNTRGMRL